MALAVKSPPASSGDVRGMGSIPEWGRFPGERSGNPLQSPVLENPMDRGTLATVLGITRVERDLATKQQVNE